MASGHMNIERQIRRGRTRRGGGDQSDPPGCQSTRSRRRCGTFGPGASWAFVGAVPDRVKDAAYSEWDRRLELPFALEVAA